MICFQAKADFVSMPLDALNSAGAWLDKGFTNLAGDIDASRAGEWVGSAAEWITQKECAAYNYCINGLQELLPNSNVERILDGSGLILMGGFKMAGGEQKDIAKKAAMGADDAAGGTNPNALQYDGKGNWISNEGLIYGQRSKDGNRVRPYIATCSIESF